jgi:anti-sigma factor RsiW
VTCDEARALINAYVDRELDLVRSLDVEAHLHECVACARADANLRALRAAFNNGALYHEVPADVQRRIRRVVRTARRAGRRRFLAVPSYGWGAAAAVAVLIVAVIAGGVVPFGGSTDPSSREVLDDHLRSLAGNHLTDVLSSNQHTVKPWFDGRLNFTPPVKDFAAQGFPLVGGRLDYLQGHPIAAVVYRRRQHVINLLVSPAEHAADTSTSTEVRGGYNIVHWTEPGMAFWAVSSLNVAELDQFVKLVSEASSPVSTPRSERPG